MKEDDIENWSDAKLLLAKMAILWCLGSGIFTFLLFIASIVRALA